MIGHTVSHFRVTSKLGEGGMGEVYRAEDTKLGRDVALKMLPPEFAHDPERRARFEREARVLASLSHPSIAGVHDLIEDEGRAFLVMEVAEGPTLSELIRSGPLPLDRAISIAIQIAEAFEAAHERGVVHRDLKPANVKVTLDGKVKVLDFGLAKALDSALGEENQATLLRNSPTLTEQMTTDGVLLGTAGYMSPEQARGQPADRRSDIWAFGCVLFEMLTAERAFPGDTLTDVLAAVVQREPDLSLLPPEVPRRIRVLLERCLRKDATRRLQAIGDARIVLQDYLDDPSSTDVPAQEAAGTARGRLPWVIAAVASVLAVVAAVSGYLAGRAATDPEPMRRLDVRMGDRAFDYSLGSSVVVAPSGRSLAYVTGIAGSEALIHLRALDQSVGLELVSGTGTDTAPYHPFFSPDGEWLGYVTASEMRKISVTGGTPMTLTPVERSRGASWGERGIVFARSPASPLSIVPAVGGTPTDLTTLDESREEASHRWPQWLSDGRSVLFTVATSSTNAASAWLDVVDVESGERKTVQPGGYYGRYVESGHLLYANENTLFAVPFDLDRLETTGPAVPVLDDVAGASSEGTAHYDVSDDGMLVYLTGEGPAALAQLVWTDRSGSRQLLWEEPGIYGAPKLSPDGSRLSISQLRDNNWDVWVFDLERSVVTRLTFDPGYDADQVWSPDGVWLAFASNRGGAISIYRKRADGGGEAELIAEYPAGGDWYPVSWSSDGRTLITQSASQAGDIWVVPLEGDGEPRAFQASSFSEQGGALSPDGTLLAYHSNESGREEIYVRPFPEGAGKWQLSEGGGSYPRWSANGRELYFRTGEGVAAVAIESTGGGLRADRRRTVLEGEFLGGLAGVVAAGFVFPDFDVTGDGQRFVMLTEHGEDVVDENWVRLVTGWFQELQELAPTD